MADPAPVLTTPVVVALAVASCLITIAVGFPLLRWLRYRQIGKAIRVDGPAHAGKAGTPTMGGLAMLAAIAVTTAILVVLQPWLLTGGGAPGASGATRSGLLLPLVAAAFFGGLGILDDAAGLARRSAGGELGVGLTARRAFALQIGLALAIGLSVGPSAIVRLPTELVRALAGHGPASAGSLQTALAGPMTPIAGLAIAVLAILGCVNGVNLSDGLDGLAAGLSAMALATMGMAAAFLLGAATPAAATDPVRGPIWSAPAVLGVVAAGACVGFLYFNRHPARLFMGNVGSMALGAILATTALQAGTWWLLPVVGAVLVAEVLSDVLQVAYFRRSGGKRLLRMAPLHHHFELGGLHEVQVVRRFWIAGALAAASGLAIVAWLTARQGF